MILSRLFLVSQNLYFFNIYTANLAWPPSYWHSPPGGHANTKTTILMYSDSHYKVE